jgi:glycosyltransferase involved in cell wall biosynthesis
MRSLKILFTNNTLDTRAGSELWVRDMALALQARGHICAGYSTVLGAVAEELRGAGVVVVDDLDELPWQPDLIHCHHHLEAITALVRFPGVPAVFVCHGAIPWEEEPLLHPSIRRWIGVDSACHERLIHAGVPADRTTTVRNFVDLARFRKRSLLPVAPQRALVFSNQIEESNGLAVIRKACRKEGVAVDAAGLAVGNVVSAPEDLLREYHIVFAKGRAALEAMAVGCAVVLCDSIGLGPSVRSENVEHLRTLNFGFQTLTEPISLDAIRTRIRGYDAADAARVSEWIRADASLGQASRVLEQIYEEAAGEAALIGTDDQSRAVSDYIRNIALRVKYHEGVRHERDLLDHRLRRLALRRLFFRR